MVAVVAVVAVVADAVVAVAAVVAAAPAAAATAAAVAVAGLMRVSQSETRCRRSYSRSSLSWVQSCCCLAFREGGIYLKGCAKRQKKKTRKNHTAGVRQYFVCVTLRV